jgi:DNA repair protein RadC
MEAMINGRALSEGGHREGARATMPGVGQAAVAPGARRAVEPQELPVRLAFDHRSLDAIDRLDHNSVSGAELLELLLCFGKSGPEAGPVARELIDHFGSLGAVLAAAPDRLIGLMGGDQASVLLLKIIRVAVKTTLREPLEDRPVIGSASALMDYLSVTMRHEPTEATRVLFLDRKNGLIKDETLHRGTIDHTPLYPREVVRRVIETGASAIILVHNHPSGDPSPSKADIAMTKELMSALGTIGGVLHDHVIVGRNREISFRKSGLI